MISIFSLGGHCEPSLAMNLYFDAKRANSAFDWLVTPYRSLLAVLQDDGEQLGIDFRLMGGSIFCERYRLNYHHEFSRTVRDEITFSARQISDLRDKLIYKHREMLRVARETSVVFIRLGVATDVRGDHHQGGALSLWDVEELSSILRRKLGHTDYKLVLIERHWPEQNRREHVPAAPHLGEVRIREYNQLPGMGYSGDPAFWAELFTSFELNPGHILASGSVLPIQDVA